MPLKIAQSSPFTSAWACLGTLARTLRATWMVHRWCLLAEKQRSIAAPRPLPPSEMTRSGADIPRSVRNAIQAFADLLAPGARPKKTGLPEVSMPQATSTGSALAFGCIVAVAAVQVEVVDARLRQLPSLPGVEIGPQALTDAARRQAADLRLVAEDLLEQSLDIAV
jgi:hypothetical protein